MRNGQRRRFAPKVPVAANQLRVRRDDAVGRQQVAVQAQHVQARRCDGRRSAKTCLRFLQDRLSGVTIRLPFGARAEEIGGDLAGMMLPRRLGETRGAFGVAGIQRLLRQRHEGGKIEGRDR